MQLNYSFKSIVYSTLFALFILFGATSLYRLNIQYDEINHHLPTTLLFLSTDPLSALSHDEYRSANTPFPYMVNSLIHYILGVHPTVTTLRILNLSWGVGFIVLLLLYFNKHAPNNLFLVFNFFFYPYFLKTTFSYFMAIYGLLFLLLYLVFLKKTNDFSELKSGLTVSLGALSQQFLVPLIMHHFLHQIFKHIDGNIRQWGVRIIKLLLPILPLLLLFIYWSGMTHPNYRKHALGFSLTGAATMMVSIGLPFLPYAIYKIHDTTWKKMLIILIISFVFASFFFPVWTNAPQLGYTSGISFNTLHKVSHISPLLGFLGKVFLIFAGLITLVNILNPLLSTHQNKFLVLVMSAAFLFNEVSSERHFVSLVMLLFLSVSQEVFPKKFKVAWLSYSAVIGVAYFYYLNFIYRIS